MSFEIKLEGKAGPVRQRRVVGANSYRTIGAYIDPADSKLYSSDASSGVIFKKNSTSLNIQFFTGVTEGNEIPATPTSELVLNDSDFFVKVGGSDLLQATTAGGGGPGAPYGDGKVDEPSIAFTDELDTGFYRIGSDNVGLAIDGIKRADFATTQFQYLADNDGSTDFGQLVVRGSTNSNKFLSFCLDTTGNRALIQSGIDGIGYNDLLFGRNNGSLLIGNASNTYTSKLFVDGSVGASDTITINSGTEGTPAIRFNSATDTGIFYDVAMKISVGGTSRASIDSTSVNVKSLTLTSQNANTIEIKTPSALSASYSLVLPKDEPEIGSVLAVDSQGICNFIDPFIAMFGSGADGNVTISGTVTLTRDMYYNDLTVNGANVINTNSFKIFVKGTLTIGATTSVNGVIRSHGNNGNNASSSTGASAAATSANGSFGTNAATAAGGTGSTTTGANGGTGAQSSVAHGIAIGGAGGAGGSGSAGAGGANRAVTVSVSTARNIQPFHINGRSGSQLAGGSTGSGGSAGGGNSSVAGGGGGSGGTGGGVVFVYAKKISVNPTAVAPIFGSFGGNGGNGFSTPNSNCGGGGGGGGGSSGVIIIFCKELLTTPPANWISLRGGNGGNGGNGNGTGNGGTGGGGGSAQSFLFYMCMSRGVYLIYNNIAGVALATGTVANSGATGGTGNTGATYNVSTY